MGRKKIYIPHTEENKNDSLRERVYAYLDESMSSGRLRYGEYLDQNSICRELGVSKAPLRDALIRLEAEGFVTIQPNRGVFINPLTIEFIKSAYAVIGAIESDCLNTIFHKLTEEHIQQFEASNELQRQYLEANQYKEYYEENVSFHNIFLSLSENILIRNILTPIRRRLYGFPRKIYAIEWENVHLEEHKRFIDSVRKGNKTASVSIFRDEHWSFEVHKRYLGTYYTFD